MNRVPIYQVASNEITSGTTTGVKQNVTLWHPKTSSKDILITEIGVNPRVVQTAGTFSWELQFISAENGTPGGTVITPQPLNDGEALTSDLTVRQVPNSPTTVGPVFQRASFPLPSASAPMATPEGFIVFRAQDVSDLTDAILLPAGEALGLTIVQNVAATLTTAPVFTIYVRLAAKV